MSHQSSKYACLESESQKQVLLEKSKNILNQLIDTRDYLPDQSCSQKHQLPSTHHLSS